MNYTSAHFDVYDWSGFQYAAKSTDASLELPLDSYEAGEIRDTVIRESDPSATTVSVRYPFTVTGSAYGHVGIDYSVSVPTGLSAGTYLGDSTIRVWSRVSNCATDPLPEATDATTHTLISTALPEDATAQKSATAYWCMDITYRIPTASYTNVATATSEQGATATASWTQQLLPDADAEPLSHLTVTATAKTGTL
jgi:hypothetical protein